MNYGIPLNYENKNEENGEKTDYIEILIQIIMNFKQTQLKV